MNYFEHYSRLIKRARSRNRLNGYVEVHHVVPTCMDGSDEAYNLVRLTAEEHYVAHLLLVKMFPNNQKLVFAAWMMCNAKSDQVQRNNKTYGWLRRKAAEAASEAMTGREVSDEFRVKMSVIGGQRSGHKLTEQHKEKISLGLKRAVASGLVQSKETRAKRNSTLRGRPLSEEHKRSISETLTGRPGHRHYLETRALIKEIWDLRRKKWGRSGRPPKPSLTTQ